MPMTLEELKYKESKLRSCFKEKLVMAEGHEGVSDTQGSVTMANTMNFKATGFRMTSRG